MSSVPNSRHIENPRETDVLFGRGAPFIRWKGNVKFRELVNKRKGDYHSTRRHADKNIIAREIMDFIRYERNGRFLIKASELNAEMESADVSSSWTEADDGLILEKVKQTLRDKQFGKKRGATTTTGKSGSTKSSSPTLSQAAEDASPMFDVLEEKAPSIVSTAFRPPRRLAPQDQLARRESDDGARPTFSRSQLLPAASSHLLDGDGHVQSKASQGKKGDVVTYPPVSSFSIDEMQPQIFPSEQRTDLERLQLLYGTRFLGAARNRLNGRHYHVDRAQDRRVVPPEASIAELLESISRPHTQASVYDLPEQLTQPPQGMGFLHELTLPNIERHRSGLLHYMLSRRDLLSPLLSSTSDTHRPELFNLARQRVDGTFGREEIANPFTSSSLLDQSLGSFAPRRPDRPSGTPITSQASNSYSDAYFDQLLVDAVGTSHRDKER